MQKAWMAAAAVGAALVAGQARAAAITETFTGTVTSGTDDLGLFGTKGLGLTGDAFTLTAVLNTQSPNTVCCGYIVFGGPIYGDPLPDISVDLSIGGKDFSIDISGAREAEFFAKHYSTTAQDQFGAAFLLVDWTASNSLEFDTFTSGAILDPGMVSLGPGTGSFRPIGSASTLQFAVTDSIAGPLPAGANVPEPGAWALLLAGFGLVGAVLRKRPSSFRPA